MHFKKHTFRVTIGLLNEPPTSSTFPTIISPTVSRCIVNGLFWIGDFG
jgi:hypothetical protein